MKKLTDFSFCKFLFVLGFTTLLAACSEESTDKVNNVINSSIPQHYSLRSTFIY